MRLEDPAPIMGSTWVSSAMVPKKVQSFIHDFKTFLTKVFYHRIEKQSDWKFDEQNSKKNLKKLKS